MRVDSTGQMSGQRVKTKSATQTEPRRSSEPTARSLRSVSANGGMVPRTGSGSARRQPDPVVATRAPTRASASRRPGRRSVARRGTATVLDRRDEKPGDGTEVGQEHEHEEDAEDRRREGDVGEGSLLM